MFIGLAQSQTEVPARHEFEVVSIKPNKVDPDSPSQPYKLFRRRKVCGVERSRGIRDRMGLRD